MAYDPKLHLILEGLKNASIYTVGNFWVHGINYRKAYLNIPKINSFALFMDGPNWPKIYTFGFPWDIS